MEQYLSTYPPVLSIHEVAEILRITERTARKLVDASIIRGSRVGRMYKMPKESIVKYLTLNE